MLQWWSLLWAELPQSLAPMAEVKFAYSVCGHAGCYVTFAVFVLLTPLQISTDVFCILTLLVLLNNSELALLLFPPLYQNKCEGENPCCLGSVSLFMNQRMLDHNYPCTITMVQNPGKAGCYLPFFSECSICPHPQCRDAGGSSMRVIIISAAVLYACSISETGNGVPFLFPGHTSLVPLFTASAVTCRGGCSALRGQLHFRAGVAVQIANHSNSITVISWKRRSVRGVNRTGKERKAYKLLCSGPV